MGNKNWERAKKAGKYGAVSLSLMTNMASADRPKPLAQQSKEWYGQTRSAEQRRRSSEISRGTRGKNQPTVSEIIWGKQGKKPRPLF